MQNIYANTITADDRKTWRCIILDNLVSTFQILLDVLVKHNPNSWRCNSLVRKTHLKIEDSSYSDNAKVSFGLRVSSGADGIRGDQLPLEFSKKFRDLLAEEAIQNASQEAIRGVIRDGLLNGKIHTLPEDLD